jgi:hypothetical protein
MVEDVLQKKSLAVIGSKFHRSLARIVAEVSALISELKDAALSGGAKTPAAQNDHRRITKAWTCPLSTIMPRPMMEELLSARRPLVILP